MGIPFKNNMKSIDILVDHLIRSGHIPEEDRDIYLYGFDITFYTIWSTAVLLLIGLFCRQFPAAVIIVAGFYTFQTTGGGYHAKSHLKCFLTMIAGLLVGLSFIFLKGFPVLLWILLGIGALLLFLVPLVLHPNKSYLETERKRLTIRSVVLTLSLLVSVIVLNIFWNSFLYAFSVMFLLAGISRIAGKIAYDK